MSNLKVEGKVADWCPKCKNCKSTTRECNGEKDWLMEVECEDPYDGMIKTLAADSDICCSMFEFKPDRGRYPWGKDKNENESMYSDLIKASKRKDELIQNYREKLKKTNDEINLLNSKLDKLGEYYRTDEKLIDNIQKVIFPQEEGSDYTYSYDEILDKVKELKEELEKLKNTDISKVPICKEILSTISELKDRNEELEKKIDDKNKDIDILLEDNKRMNERNSELYQVSLNKSRDIIDIGKKLKRQECLNDINADIIPRLMLENQRLLTRNRKLQVKLNDILLNPESNRLEEEDK